MDNHIIYLFFYETISHCRNLVGGPEVHEKQCSFLNAGKVPNSVDEPKIFALKGEFAE